MWADNETTSDLLNVSPLVRVVSETIRAQRLLPLTIGIYGGWGTGKSSLVQMIRAEVEKDEGVVCISFNGWLFENYEDAKSALMGTILNEIRSRRTLGAEARDLLGKLKARVAWFRVMALAGKGALTIAVGGGAAALAAGGLAAGAKVLARSLALTADQADVEDLYALEGANATEEPLHAVRAFREDFVKLLEQARITSLVVFIDELDRCLPETVVQTLEAIRLFLFVERTAFVIGADERLVKHAVRQRFSLEGMDSQVGADYLEKMIQIPFRIPQLGPTEIHTYMNLLFAELHCEADDFSGLIKKLPLRQTDGFGEVTFSSEDARELLSSVPAQLTEAFVLTEQIAATLTHGLAGNPRQTKRFLNELLLRMRLAELRGIALRRDVLAKLMLLENFRPEHFRELATWQRQQDGRPAELTFLEHVLRPKEGNEPEDGAKSVSQQERQTKRALKTAATPEDGESGGIPDLVKRAQAWREDRWLRDWAEIQPLLQDVDLRPYFYVARQKIGHTEGSSRVLSPDAIEAFRYLRSASETARRRGQEMLKTLSLRDAMGVLQELGELARKPEPFYDGDDARLRALFLAVEVQPDLASEVIEILRSLPEEQLPGSVVQNLLRSTKGQSSERLARGLVEQWRRSTSNPRLARAASRQLY